MWFFAATLTLKKYVERSIVVSLRNSFSDSQRHWIVALKQPYTEYYGSVIGLGQKNI